MSIEPLKFKPNSNISSPNGEYLTARKISPETTLKIEQNPETSLAVNDLVSIPEAKGSVVNPFTFNPKLTFSQNKVPEITRQLAGIKLEKPDQLKSIGIFFESLVKVVDPNEPLKSSVEKMFINNQNALNLIGAYSTGGVFAEKTLKNDLLNLLPGNNSVPPGKIEEIAGIMARQARITAINRLNAPGTPSKLPTRPIGVEATPFPQKDIVVDGMRLRYIDVGPEKPKGTILFIHGHQSTLEEFNDLIPELSREYRCLAVDLPGSGYSEQPDINYSLELYENTLIHFLDKLGVNKATVAGGSLGGNMALRLGRKAPERFPDVISWSPAGVWKPKPFMSFMAKTDLLTGPLYWTMLKFQSTKWYKDGFPGKQEIIYGAMKYRREVDSVQFRRSTGQIAAQQLKDTHRGLGYLNKQPTLLLVGRDDTGLDLAKNAIEFSKEMPNVELKIFENTGHSIHGERPQELVKEMQAFLRKQEASGI